MGVEQLELRAESRHVTELPVTVTTEGGMHAEAVCFNLSPTGMGLCSLSKLVVGQTVQLSIEFSSSRPDAVRAKVVWTKESMAGVEFVDRLNARQLTRLLSLKWQDGWLTL